MADVVFHCRDQDGNSLNGVLIRLFDSLGAFFTQGTTGEGVNATGKKLFQGIAVGNWTARFSLSSSGWSVISPQAFTVTGTTDSFDATVNLFVLPNAQDANLCRCSGYFRSPTGSPSAGSSIRFVNLSRPALLGNDGILGEYVSTETDSKGHASVDLIRKGRYRVELESFLDLNLEVRVPDAPAAGLPDLLFPIVKKVTFSPTSLAVIVGETKTTTPTIRWRSGLELGLTDASGAVTFAASPTDVIELSVDGAVLKAKGLKTGTVTVTAVRNVPTEGTPVTTVPDVGAVEGSLTVTVS